jgi:hypothetical protein
VAHHNYLKIEISIQIAASLEGKSAVGPGKQIGASEASEISVVEREAAIGRVRIPGGLPRSSQGNRR